MENDDFYASFSSEKEEFYTLTLLGENGKMVQVTQTYWVGFTDDKPPRETRKPRLVSAQFAKIFWHDMGQPFVVVRSPEQMLEFLVLGGNALVVPALFEIMGMLLEPAVVVPDGYIGYSGIDRFGDAAFKRTPTAKLRMKVLKRDRMRCRICGRNPDDHIDLELHVHHIRPWSEGGVTTKENLITLCNSCHGGLDPHFDPSLFVYTIPEEYDMNSKLHARKHRDGVREYRMITIESGEEA